MRIHPLNHCKIYEAGRCSLTGIIFYIYIVYKLKNSEEKTYSSDLHTLSKGEQSVKRERNKHHITKNTVWETQKKVETFDINKDTYEHRLITNTKNS